MAISKNVAAGMPAGSVLQVVQATTTTNVGITSTSYTDVGLSASITPSSSSNKILILVICTADLIRQSNGITGSWLNAVRNSTIVYEKNCGYGGAAVSTSGYWYVPQNANLTYLDSPSTTSSITYKVQGKITDIANGSELRMQVASGSSTIILMEIAS